jgi:hypothetical protein
MKKFVVFLIACVVMVQAAYGATSALTESLLEYEAITSAIGTDPNFQNIIPPNEFIIDIKRLTKHLDVLGDVEYKILTRSLSEHHHHSIKYIATLNVSPNPGIGPNIITVVSIVHHHNHDHD